MMSHPDSRSHQHSAGCLSSTAAGGADAEPRCGTIRASMETNVLLAKTQLGKVKKTTFNNAPADRVCGTVLPPDPEGARAVISTWKSHIPNPHSKPGPDFLAMNAAAADVGLVSSGQFKAFRDVHPITLRSGVEGVAKPAAALPSDADPAFTYGLPAAHRTAETVRNCGAEEPRMKALMQGGYSAEWVRMNMARKDEFDDKRHYIAPRATKTTEGHRQGAQRVMAAAEAAATGGAGSKQWKMPRFEKGARSKVSQHMGGRSGQHQQQGYPQAQAEQFESQDVC